MLRIVQSFWRIDAYHYVISLFILGNFPYSEFCFSWWLCPPSLCHFPYLDLFSSLVPFLIYSLHFKISLLLFCNSPFTKSLFSTSPKFSPQKFQRLVNSFNIWVVSISILITWEVCIQVICLTYNLGQYYLLIHNSNNICQPTYLKYWNIISWCHNDQ